MRIETTKIAGNRKIGISLLLFILFLTPKVFSQISPVISFTENPYNHNMHITSDGTYFYTINGGNAAMGQVNKFTLTGTLIQTYPIAIDGRGFSYNQADGFLYVSTYLGDIVKITNLAAGTFTTVFTTIMQNDQSSFALSPDGTKFYDFYQGTLKIHSLATGAVLSTLTGLFYGAGGAITGDACVAVDASDLIYTWNATSQTVYIYNQLGVLTSTLLLASGSYGFSLSIANCYLFASVDGSYSTGTWYGYNISCCPTAAISYTGSPFCSSLSTAQTVTLTGTGAYTGGTYSASPAGLTINSSTGEITPNTSTAGTYTVSYTIAASGSCPVVVATSSVTITAPPSASINYSGSPFCASLTTAQSVSLSGTGAYTSGIYSVSPSTGLSINTTTGDIIPSSSTAGTYTVTYSIPASASCPSDTTTFTVIINPTPSFTTPATITICNNDIVPAIPFVSTPTGAIFGWNNSNTAIGLPATGSGDISSFTATNTGNSPIVSTITVVPVLNGCSGTPSTFTITVNPSPVLTPTATPASICIGYSSSLSVSSSVAATTFSWMPGSMAGTPLTVSPGTTTTYTVTGTASTCTSSTTVSVSVNQIPVVTAFATQDSVCFGTTTSLSATSSIAGSTFLWLPGNLTGTPVSVTPASTTIYTVVGTVSGCSGSSTITITVEPSPSITPYASPDAICIGNSSSLSATSNVGGTTFLWMPGSMSGTPVNVTPGSTTTYTVTGTSAIGCTGSLSVTVTVNPNIVVTPSAMPTSICYGSHSTLSATSNLPGTNFIWMPGVLTGSSVNVSPSITTTYTIVGTNSTGCSGTNTVTVTCFNSSQIGIYAIPDSGCSPLNAVFNYAPVNLIADSTWHWDFGDIYSSNNTSQDSTGHHIYVHDGPYTATFTAKDMNGCDISTTTNVDVFIKPQAEFYYNPGLGIAEIKPINFADFSAYADYWFWNFGDADSNGMDSSNLVNPTHMYADSGTYTVRLVVTTIHGCTDTVYHDVTINPNYYFWVPNAFTPNGDGRNEDFKPVVLGIDKSTYKFMIYDRWGKQIFYTNNLDASWDGKSNGLTVPEGVYTYIVSFDEYNTIHHEYVKSVVLFR